MVYHHQKGELVGFKMILMTNKPIKHIQETGFCYMFHSERVQLGQRVG